MQIILSKAFDLKCTIPEIKGVGEPLLIYVRAPGLISSERELTYHLSAGRCLDTA